MVYSLNETDPLVGSDRIRSFDLFLSAVQTIVTFGVANPAPVALGSASLRTSPARGLASGRMEASLAGDDGGQIHTIRPPRY